MHGFTADRAEFLGRRGDYARPEALERWGLAGRVDAGRRPVRRPAGAPGARARRADRDALRPRARRPSREEALTYVARFRDGGVVDVGVAGSCGAFWDELARERARQDAGAGDGPHAQPVAALPDALVARLRSHGLLPVERRVRVSRPAAGRAGAAARGARRARARTSSRRPGTSSRKATSCTGGTRPPAGACARAARTTWPGSRSSRPSTSSRRETTSILSEPVPFLTGEPLRHDEHDRYAEFASLAARARRSSSTAAGRSSAPRPRAATACP